MNDILKLTEDYVAAFDKQDLPKTVSFEENFQLTAPEVMALQPKDNILEYIRDLLA